MKKLVLFVLIIFLLSFFISVSNLVLAADIPGMPSGLQPDKVTEAGEQAKTKWEYLNAEWKNMVLKNPVVSSINSFFTQISIVFRILFGVQYSFSFMLLVIVFFWLWLMLKAAELARLSIGMRSGLSYFFGAFVSIVFAQLQIFRIFADLLFDLVMTREAWWARLIVVLIILGALILISYLSKFLPAWLRKKQYQLRQKTLEVTESRMDKFFKAVKKGAKQED